MQMGYNFLYGLWKYQWDADCELFLKILQVGWVWPLDSGPTQLQSPPSQGWLSESYIFFGSWATIPAGPPNHAVCSFSRPVCACVCACRAR